MALRLRAANPAAERLMRRDLYSLIGSRVEEAFPALVGSRLRDRLAGVVERGVPLRGDDLIVQPADAEQRVVTLRAFPLPDRSVAISLQDITDAVAASEALRRQAVADAVAAVHHTAEIMAGQAIVLKSLLKRARLNRLAKALAQG